MKSIKSYITVAALAMSAAASAQNLNTGYFNEGYLYRHDINPAIGNEQNYVAIPVVGNMNFNMGGNIGIKDVLFNRNSRTVTFLHPEVNAGDFLSNINDNNKLTESLKLQLIGIGFKGFKGYNTIEINARENVGATLPGSIFRLMKEGIKNETYDIKDLNVHADAYAELALGHSHQISDNLRVGGKMKVLLGVANIDANFNKAEIALNENEYKATVDAEIQTSMKGFTYLTESKMRGPEGNQTKHTYVNDVDVDGTGLNGFGLAFDLGAEYHLDDNWDFSLALLDLGFINWNNNMVASTNGEFVYNTDKYTFSPNENDVNSFDNELDKITDDLASLYELQNEGDRGSRSRSLGATMNVGAQYTPDFYRQLTFGLMNSTRFAGDYSWTEFRLSANVAPTKSFSASTSFAVGTFGTSFGWLLNVHAKGGSIFVGMDHTFGKLAKQGVPLSSNGSFNVGINIPLN